MKFICMSEDKVVRLACAELARHANIMTGKPMDETKDSAAADFILGTYKDVSGLTGVKEQNDKWHDAVLLKSITGKLVLSGPNPRCVLFSVYDYLERLGCKWLFPGPGGDLLPENGELKLDGFDILEKAEHNYRGLAAFPKDADSARKLIEWMPKRKYNLYFLEGYGADRPGDKWSVVNGEHPLQHIEHALKGKTWEERLEIIRQQESAVEEARKRGLLIERYGHGWNYGLQEHYADLKGISREEACEELRAKGKVNKAAEVAGTWFQLCMSKPEVKDIYVEHIVDYLTARKGEVDIAAVWLGDGYDNSCQCEECLKKPFSDWYLEILSEVGRRMKKIAPDLKIEGLVYFETLEPPTKRFLDGLDNIVLIFAPWNRCYIHALDDPNCRYPGWKPDYRNNRSHDKERFYHPLNADYFEAYQGWRKNIPNVCYFFEYFVLSTSSDRVFLRYNARNLVRDIKDFKRLGFEGCVSCQAALMDIPINLVSETVGLVLWNSSADPERIRRNLVEGLFGKWANAVMRHLNEMYAILTMIDVHKNLYKTESAEVLHAIIMRLNTRLDEFDKELPAAAIERPYLSRIIELKLEIFMMRRRFQEGLYFHDKAAHRQVMISYVNEAMEFINANRGNMATRDADDEMKGLKRALDKM